MSNQPIQTTYPLEVYLNIKHRFSENSIFYNGKSFINKQQAKRIISYIRISKNHCNILGSNYTLNNELFVHRIDCSKQKKILSEMHNLKLIRVTKKNKIWLE